MGPKSQQRLGRDVSCREKRAHISTKALLRLGPSCGQHAKETISFLQEENEISARNYHYDMRVGKGFLNKTGKTAEHKKDDYIWQQYNTDLLFMKTSNWWKVFATLNSPKKRLRIKINSYKQACHRRENKNSLWRCGGTVYRKWKLASE